MRIILNYITITHHTDAPRKSSSEVYENTDLVCFHVRILQLSLLHEEQSELRVCLGILDMRKKISKRFEKVGYVAEIKIFFVFC